jgi:hypothetical protein
MRSSVLGGWGAIAIAVGLLVLLGGEARAQFASSSADPSLKPEPYLVVQGNLFDRQPWKPSRLQ